MATTTEPIAGPTMMLTGAVPGGDVYVVLNDVLASLKMRTEAAELAWFDGECGNPHTIPLHMPLTHHFPCSQSVHAIKCSICSYLCTAFLRDLHHVYLCGSRRAEKVILSHTRACDILCPSNAEVLPLSFLLTEKAALSSSHSFVSSSNSRFALSLRRSRRSVDRLANGVLMWAPPLISLCIFNSCIQLKLVLVTFIVSSSSALNERTVHPHTQHLQPRLQQ